MITTFLLNILSSFISGVISYLPTGSLPVQVSTSVSSIWGYMNLFSYVIALDTLLQVLILVIIFDGVLLAWKFINWIIRKVPGMQ